MRFVLLTLVGLSLLALVPPADAGSCGVVTAPTRTVSYGSVVHHDDTPYFFRFAAVIPLVEIPTYSTTLAPAAAVVTQQTLTTTSTQATSPATSTTVVQGGGGSADTKEILASLKTLTGLVSRVAEQQQGHEARLRAIEARIGPAAAPPPPGPPPPPAPAAPPATPKASAETAIPGALVVYANRCASCHQKGNEGRGGDFVLLTQARERANLTGRQLQALTRHITRGTMPPKAPLSNEEATAVLEDLPNFTMLKE